MLRAIHAIPDTSDLPQIEAFRQRFDPLFPHIRAHITLVFPFDSSLDDEALIAHTKVCAEGLQAFEVDLISAERSADDHFWLAVNTSPALRDLSQRLHQGPLASISSRPLVEKPHITLARPPLPSDIEDEFLRLQVPLPIRLKVSAILLEAIEPCGASVELGIFTLSG